MPKVGREPSSHPSSPAIPAASACRALGMPNTSLCSARRSLDMTLTTSSPNVRIKWQSNSATESQPAAHLAAAGDQPSQTPSATNPRFDARARLHRLCGVDLAQVPGLQVNTTLVLFTELGPDFVTRFPTAKCFAFWLGLCPDNLISGGRIIAPKTRDVKSHRTPWPCAWPPKAFGAANDYLGEMRCRWKARLGTPKAITAMARKLARILYPQIPSTLRSLRLGQSGRKTQTEKIKRLQQNAAASALNSSPHDLDASFLRGRRFHLIQISLVRVASAHRSRNASYSASISCVGCHLCGKCPSSPCPCKSTRWLLRVTQITVRPRCANQHR